MLKEVLTFVGIARVLLWDFSGPLKAGGWFLLASECFRRVHGVLLIATWVILSECCWLFFVHEPRCSKPSAALASDEPLRFLRGVPLVFVQGSVCQNAPAR